MTATSRQAQKGLSLQELGCTWTYLLNEARRRYEWAKSEGDKTLCSQLGQFIRIAKKRVKGCQPTNMSLPYPERARRLAQIADLAVAAQTRTQCPAEMTVAQWAVESKWGEKPVGHANYFGIKKAERHQLACWVMTHEGTDPEPKRLEFADYPDLEASVADYCG